MRHHQICADAIRQLTCAAFERVGCSAKDGADATSALMWASLRGVDTHGIRNLVPYYVNNIRGGEIDPTARISIEHETNSCARLNGGAGLGLVNASAAMRLAIDKAQSVGIGMVAINNTYHLGAAGYYAQLALEHGMLGVCTTGHFFPQGHENAVAAINGAIPMFSTNPISFAAPCGRNPPFILDMSTSVATVNRIQNIGQSGDVIPDGWAKDPEGRPTNDPATAKILYPLGGEQLTGGHKGIGLSMMASILTGILSGGWSELTESHSFDQTTPAHFLAAIRVDQFMPIAQFTAAMDAFLEAVQSGTRVDAEREIHYPGSQEHSTAQQRQRDGIPVDARLFEELRELAESLSIETKIFD